LAPNHPAPRLYWEKPTRAAKDQEHRRARSPVPRVDSLLSYAIAIVMPALDAIFPVLPSETAIIALGVVNNGRMALDGILRRDQSESQGTCCLEQVEVLS
jgi:hypothetical protein